MNCNKITGKCLSDLSGFFLLFILFLLSCNSTNKPQISNAWNIPDTSLIDNERNSGLIQYGKELIVNTAFYMGPQGSVMKNSNGMNCQNCHLQAGTKLFGNNYSAVASTYPKFRARSGKIETIAMRINDCIQRSLNGKPIDTAGKEMQAMIEYIRWLGKNVSKGEIPYGAGISDLVFPQHITDTLHGREIFHRKCVRCHSANGGGKLNSMGYGYEYPPLWGSNSYNIGAGLYRLSKLAGLIKSNMPYGVSYFDPELTDEEAWNIAAFISSQQRPLMDLSHDWPVISSKPIDYPFGPYADNYSEKQHKYGPFGPILQTNKIGSK